MTTVESTPAQLNVDRKQLNKVAWGAFLGTTLEWYDYYLYGTASALVFNMLFFGEGLPAAVATLYSFATFAVGFIVRPLGGLLFGHLGDRVGRRAALLASVVIMGVATFAIGALPTYAAIGVAAPIILVVLRLLQGLSAGGEWTGAMTLLLEHAPADVRGRYSVLPQLGGPAGTLLSSAAFAIMGVLTANSFDAWGWRIPFLLALPMLCIAVYIRLKLEESPVFVAAREAKDDTEDDKVPLLEVIRSDLGRVVTGTLATIMGIAAYYILTTFFVSYATSMGLSRQLALNSTLIVAAVQIVWVYSIGFFADRLGARRIIMIGGAGLMVFAFPIVALVSTGTFWGFTLGALLGVLCQAFSYSIIGKLLIEMFPVRTRYTAVGLCYNLAGVVGGLMPFLAQSGLNLTGGASWSIAVLLALLGLSAVAGGLFARPITADSTDASIGAQREP